MNLQLVVNAFVAALALLFALVGVIIPGLPGIPVLWLLVALDYWWLGRLGLAAGSMVILSVLAAATLIIDQLATLVGVKKRGGSFLGVVGTIVGLVGGMVLFNIPGMLIGCFTGALVGELINGQQFQKATSIAFGSLVGYAFATAFKLAVWVYYTVTLFIYIFAI